MRYLLLIALLFSLNNFANAAKLERECNNTDLDSAESICGEIRLDSKYTECKFSFKTTVDFTDFDIVFAHRYGKQTAEKVNFTEFDVTGDYTTLEGHLWKITTDLSGATAAAAIHSLILIRMQNEEAIEFFASSTNANVEGWLSCNDL